MNITTLLSIYAKNSEYITEYLSICSQTEESSNKTENHHILPRSMFPEYANINIHKFNKAVISKKNHLIAHWLLYKMMKNNECTHAFRMMVEMKRGLDDLSREEIEKIAEDYSYAKIQSNNYISDTMKQKMYVTNGKVQFYINLSEPIPEGFKKGRLPAFDKGTRLNITTNERTKQIRILKEDIESYLLDGWIIGTKKITKITNGIENKKLIGINPIIPNGWVIGTYKTHKEKQIKNTISRSKNISSKRKGKKYFCGPNNEQIFCIPGEEPLGWSNRQSTSHISKWLPDNCYTTKKVVWHDKKTKELYYLPFYIDFSSDYIEGMPILLNKDESIKKGSFWVHNESGKTKMVKNIEDGWVLGRIKNKKSHKCDDTAGIPKEGFRFLLAQSAEGEYLGRIASYDPRWGKSIFRTIFDISKTYYVKSSITGEIIGEIPRYDDRIISGEYIKINRPQPKRNNKSITKGSFWVHNESGKTKMVKNIEDGWVLGRTAK